nr:hypothetical protein [Abalone asfa-like virus]
MSMVFYTTGLYWLMVYLVRDFAPQPETDFLVLDKYDRTYPVYHITDKNKLYIVAEKPVINHTDFMLQLYFNDNIVDLVLQNGELRVPLFSTSNKHLKDYYFEREKYQVPKSDIKTVIRQMKSNFLLSKQIEEKMVKKYSQPTFVVPNPNKSLLWTVLSHKHK